MEDHCPLPTARVNQTNILIWALIALESILAIIATLWTPSEASEAFLLGYSLPRLIVAGALSAGAFLAFLAMLWTVKPVPLWNRLNGVLDRLVFRSAQYLYGCFLVLFTIITELLTSLALITVLGLRHQLSLYLALLARLGPLMGWGILVVAELAWMVYLRNKATGRYRLFLSPFSAGVLLAIATLIYTLAVKFYVQTTWDLRMRDLEDFIFLPAAVFLVWGILEKLFGDRPWYRHLSYGMLLVSIGTITYTLYRLTGEWMGWTSTPSKAYWNDLADAFLKGRLYLESPSATHDLTLYNGHWYVPNPPLPALLMLPFIAMFGLQGVNTIVFSIVWGAINVVLIFLVLEQASQLGMIATQRSANLWITVLFALGTNHWWLAILGRMWYLSQILALTFSALAVYLALKGKSPWLIGASLGLAMLSRPNVFTLWPLQAGITLFLNQKSAQKFDFKRFFSWSLQSGIPVALAAVGLLVYNYARFGDFFDFGYVTINGAEQIVEAVRTYGMFSVHFLATNLKVMLLQFPSFTIQNACLTFSASVEGYSILAMTPAVIYILRRFQQNWWTRGAWVSVILSAGLLLLYHNTGADQIGYRYLMDFIVPVLLLVAVGVGPRPSWCFKTLTLLSVFVNAISIPWWFHMWWC